MDDSFRSHFPGRAGGASGCLIVAEIGLAHDGSLGAAHAYIDSAARAGVDAVKFQTHIAEAESTPAEPWRVRFSPQDATRFEYWQRTGFTESQWSGLREHAHDANLAFLSSPFSLEAVELLERIGVDGWKVASGEVATPEIGERMLASGKPIMLSSGMSDWSELDAAVSQLQGGSSPLAVLQCTSSYPCPPQKIGLNLLGEFRSRYRVAVGLSDHSGTVFPGLAAAALGCDVLEVHLTLSREMFGPDVAASLLSSELSQLVEGVRFVEAMHASPVDKDAMAAEMAPLRDLFTKSVVARVDLPSGVVLRAEHLAAKKPGTGIAASHIPRLVGRRLSRSLVADQMVQFTDVE